MRLSRLYRHRRNLRNISCAVKDSMSSQWKTFFKVHFTFGGTNNDTVCPVIDVVHRITRPLQRIFIKPRRTHSPGMQKYTPTHGKLTSKQAPNVSLRLVSKRLNSLSQKNRPGAGVGARLPTTICPRSVVILMWHFFHFVANLNPDYRWKANHKTGSTVQHIK